MKDLHVSEMLTEQIEPSLAKTQKLPRTLPDADAHQKEEAFRAGQNRIFEMIAANAPLGEISRAWCC